MDLRAYCLGFRVPHAYLGIMGSANAFDSDHAPVAPTQGQAGQGQAGHGPDQQGASLKVPRLGSVTANVRGRLFLARSGFFTRGCRGRGLGTIVSGPTGVGVGLKAWV